MNNHVISEVGNPQMSTDAVNKLYVDTQLLNTLTGTIANLHLQI